MTVYNQLESISLEIALHSGVWTKQPPQSFLQDWPGPQLAVALQTGLHVQEVFGRISIVSQSTDRLFESTDQVNQQINQTMSLPVNTMESCQQMVC